MKGASLASPVGSLPSHTAILARPNSSSFKKVDLHVHTPGSIDMAEEWRDSTPVTWFIRRWLLVLM